MKNLATTITPLYPDLEPYATHTLPVGQGHFLYVEECGKPSGIPVVFLHGGPGAYCKPYHRSFFNPDIYRVVLFDQRGAGRSTPTGGLEHNTTWDLLADLEQLRKYLGIPTWVVYGGSWGATLGLLYAQQYPEHVSGLVLRSLFLATERDFQWTYRDGGVNRLFPKQWGNFTRLLPGDGHWDNPLAIYYDLLTGKNQSVASAAALTWSAWSACVVSYGELPALTEVTAELLNEARLECHYIFHHCFLKEHSLLEQVAKVADIPAILLHGQRDLMCPLEGPYWLEQNWPAAQLRVLPNCGHLNEPEMMAAVVEALDDMAKLLY